MRLALWEPCFGNPLVVDFLTVLQRAWTQQLQILSLFPWRAVPIKINGCLEVVRPGHSTETR